jgi:NitT/TauT family transport system substrate-binding protein
VELVSYKSEDVANQAVVNGEADIGIGTPYSMIQNVNAPIRIFYQLSKVNFFPIVNTEFYDSWEDLDGEEIVVHSRTSATLALVQLMAQRYGIEYGKISYVPGSEVRATSMLRGNIRATIIDSYNKNFLLGEAPDRFKVLPVADVNASDEALFANMNFLQENPEVVETFIVELLSTVREINANPQVVLEYREQYDLLPDLPEELEDEILPFYELAAEAGMFAEDGGGARAARSDFEFYGKGAGELKDPDNLAVEDYWYLEPLEGALERLDG